MADKGNQYDAVKALGSVELAEKLQTGAEQMFRLRFGLSMGQTDGVKKLRELRKERARILTRFRELGEKPPALHAPVAEKKAAKKTPAKKKK